MCVYVLHDQVNSQSVAPSNLVSDAPISMGCGIWARFQPHLVQHMDQGNQAEHCAPLQQRRCC